MATADDAIVEQLDEILELKISESMVSKRSVTMRKYYTDFGEQYFGKYNSTRISKLLKNIHEGIFQILI